MPPLSSPSVFDDGPVRVALVHDSRVVHAGLRHMLAPYSHRVMVLQGKDSVKVAQAHLVLHGDVRPEQFTRLTPSTMEVLYTSWPRPDIVQAAVKRGAAGVAIKDWTGYQLVSAIERSVVGSGAGTLAEPGAEPPGASLSPRERELLTLVAQGHSNEEVAEMMSVSVNSVKSYIRSAYRKIGVTRRTQAVLWALDHDLDQIGAASA
ncbi:MAG: response regulator transcription factor [Nocardioides sp.]|nr:response regulator transcription factor [Nocardioides sp.]